MEIHNRKTENRKRKGEAEEKNIKVEVIWRKPTEPAQPPAHQDPGPTCPFGSDRLHPPDGEATH
jgi:hypothetical protein